MLPVLVIFKSGLEFHMAACITVSHYHEGLDPLVPVHMIRSNPSMAGSHAVSVFYNNQMVTNE